MISGTQTGLADISDNLALLHYLARKDNKPEQMVVKRDKTI